MPPFFKGGKARLSSPLAPRSLRRRDLLLQFRKLAIDFSELRLFVGRCHIRVVLDLFAVLEQLELAYWQQLVVARFLEAVEIERRQYLFFPRIVSIGEQKVLHLFLDPWIEVFAPDERIGRNQRRTPDLAHFGGFLRVGLLQALEVFGIVGGEIDLLVGDSKQVSLVIGAA